MMAGLVDASEGGTGLSLRHAPLCLRHQDPHHSDYFVICTNVELLSCSTGTSKCRMSVIPQFLKTN